MAKKAKTDSRLEALIRRCRSLHDDCELGSVRRWKEEHENGRALGYMPIYIPGEILHAAGVLPVGIIGGGDRIEVIRGDAYFQSYICRIPRSTIELGLTGRLDLLDGMLFPAICDVIRNLSGMWQMLFPDRFVRFVDFPQNFTPEVGGSFYRLQLQGVKFGGKGNHGKESKDRQPARSADPALPVTPRRLRARFRAPLEGGA